MKKVFMIVCVLIFTNVFIASCNKPEVVEEVNEVVTEKQEDETINRIAVDRDIKRPGTQGQGNG